MSNKLELAYLAGIIDGEGCITINLRHPRDGRSIRHDLNVQCNMQNQKAILLLGQIFGGLKNYRVKDKKSNKIVYEWRVSNRKAYECLKQLFPYLRVKKEQALLGIEFHEKCMDIKRIGKFGGERKLTTEELEIRTKYRRKLQKLKRDCIYAS